MMYVHVQPTHLTMKNSFARESTHQTWQVSVSINVVPDILTVGDLGNIEITPAIMNIRSEVLEVQCVP